MNYPDLKTISDGDAFSVLNYFHICPESTDGKWIAYTRFPDGPHDSQKGPAEVIVCDREGEAHRVVGRPENVTHHRGAVPTWMDERHLLYSTTGDGDGPVNVVNVETGETQSFDGGIDNYSAALNRTYYHAPHEGLPAVWFLDLQSGNREVVITSDRMAAFAEQEGIPFEPEGLAHSYISPSGRRIAFRVGRKPDNVIIFADPDGSNLQLFGRKMMHWQFYDDDSFFGHDDVFVGDRHMRRWDLSGNIIEELSGPGCHGSVSPDGQWIVTESWYGSDPVPIYLYRRGEREPFRVLAESLPPWSTRAHVHPSFSRDGSRVYFNFNSPGSRGSRLCCIDLH